MEILVWEIIKLKSLYGFPIGSLVWENNQTKVPIENSLYGFYIEKSLQSVA